MASNNVSSRIVLKEQEVLPAFALPMVEDVGVKNQTAIRELKVELPSVKPMVVVGGVDSLIVPRVQKDALVSALHMGVDAVAVMKTAPVLPEGSPDYALDMVGARDARKKTA